MKRFDSIEQHLLLEGIYLKYGYDFRQYADASLRRRIEFVLGKFSFSTPLQLLSAMLGDRVFFNQVLPHFTVTTTELFRDPEYFKSLRENVLPMLKTYPTINIWVAGCSTGEEIYSLCIVLKEEGLYDRSTIFATDINSTALSKAKEGIYSLETIVPFAKNYTAAGGKRNPSDYYSADYGLARFDPKLKENVVFNEHNLATDGVFLEAHLILCKNVLIYFSRELQDRVLNLFLESLVYKGFLCIGSKEAVRFSKSSEFFDVFDASQKIFQKNKVVQSAASSRFGKIYL